MNNKQAFGGLERKIKPSDFHLGTLTPLVYPVSFLPVYPLTIESQLQIPDCGANAGVVLKEVFDNTPRLSVEYLWDKIKLVDGVPAESGTSMDFIFKVLKDTGVAQYQLLPTDSTLSLTAFTDPSKITLSMDTDALQRRIGVYAFTQNPTFEEIKQAIFTHKAVILLLKVGKEFWTKPDGTTSWAAKDILPLNPWTPSTSGHFMVADSYDENLIYGFNSWGVEWCGGRFSFGTNYVSRVTEIGTSVDLANPAIVYPLLKLGSTGTFVKLLQNLLNKKISAGLTIDGQFGSATRQAVYNFQKLNGLSVDGAVGNLTWAKLNL